jgi:hypothetical protein
MWTADDAHYEENALDVAYSKYKEQNTHTVIIGLRTIEDGRDITNVHRLMPRIYNSPVMAPFGIMNRQLFNQLGGYDRKFICGQSENDVVMRVRELGGKVVYCDKKVFVEHERIHEKGTVFRSPHYTFDRRILESFWIKDGKVVDKRLLPVESFEDKDITTITQGSRGQWK